MTALRRDGQTRAYFSEQSDAQLDAFVIARAANLNRHYLRRRIGPVQRDMLHALRAQPATVRTLYANVECLNLEAAIDALAGLLGRELIELHDGAWRAKGRGG